MDAHNIKIYKLIVTCSEKLLHLLSNIKLNKLGKYILQDEYSLTKMLKWMNYDSTKMIAFLCIIKFNLEYMHWQLRFRNIAILSEYLITFKW